MSYIEDMAQLLADIQLTLEDGQRSTKNGIDLLREIPSYPEIDQTLIAKRIPDTFFTADHCLYLFDPKTNKRVGSITADLDSLRYYGQIRIRLYGQMYASRWMELDKLKTELDRLLSTLCIRIVQN